MQITEILARNAKEWPNDTALVEINPQELEKRKMYGATQLNVEIQAAAGTHAPKFLPLFTLGSEHAVNVAAFLKVTHPFTGVHAQVICSEPFAAPKNGGTLTTIGVVFARGMCAIFR